jgi:hypothetical protein
MDAQQEQQQKEFISSFFPPDDHGQRALDRGPQSSNPVFPFTPNDISTTGTQTNFSGLMPLHTNISNAQVNMDLLGNLMTAQGIEGQPNPSQQYTPQLLLEQQFKLTQLQQLLQLQNQIFQQQVRLSYAVVEKNNRLGCFLFLKMCSLSLMQIALISGHNATETATEPPKDQTVRYHGLPTPGTLYTHIPLRIV